MGSSVIPWISWLNLTLGELTTKLGEGEKYQARWSPYSKTGCGEKQLHSLISAKLTPCDCTSCGCH
jgi:hypothetical protein